MEIRRLEAEDARQTWDLRLRALESEPQAFAESAEEHRRISLECYAERLGAGGDSFVLGAFAGPVLVGMAGFYREPRLKRRHIGRVWGVFVAPEYRGQRVARELLAELLRRARAAPGITIMLLTVVTTQEAARRLYRRAGFQCFGVQPRAMQAGDQYLDEELLALEL